MAGENSKATETQRVSTHLEHLNEGDTEVQICQVAADQAEREEEADRDNSAQVDAASHLNSLATVEERGVPGEDLGHDCSKGEMIRG